jgi:hypothetical protein
MKGHIVALVVIAVIAIAVLVYVEQSGAQTTRLQLHKLMQDNGEIGKIMGFDSDSDNETPQPDMDACDCAPAEYPVDVANKIPTSSAAVSEKRRGVASGIVLQGKPTAPRARPAQPRGIVVARHAADLAGQEAF